MIIVEGDEGLSASAESDLVASVVPPVVDASVASDIPEGDHAVDLAPTVLANPTVAAGVVLCKMHLV